MTAFRTTTQILEHIAKTISCEFPAEAAMLRSIRLGRKPKRNSAGNTEHAERLADLWIEIDNRVQRGEDEAEVIASMSKNSRFQEFLWNLRLLHGQNKVRRILRQRGRL